MNFWKGPADSLYGGPPQRAAGFACQRKGDCQGYQVKVLIDEGSASSSEIFGGAIQDNDRGTIIGRRSFGKGLVQEPIYFSDKSGLRLTVARFYTPTGDRSRNLILMITGMIYSRDTVMGR